MSAPAVFKPAAAKVGEPTRNLAPVDRAQALKAIDGMVADLEGPDAALATPSVAARLRLLSSAIAAWGSRDLTVGAP